MTVGLRIYNAEKWLHFFDRPMVLEILGQYLMVQVARCTIHVTEQDPALQSSSISSISMA